MYKALKRVIDYILSLIGIIVLSPVFVLLAICVKATSEGPVLFSQKRIGLNKKGFELYKFRTMRIDTPSETATADLKNPDLYVTKIGKFMRKTSLDELPQLFNVITGSMSLVGPRPPLWNQIALIEMRDKYNVHTVRPGITGWTQVNGRELPDKEKADMEKYYIDNMSFLLDAKILWLTVYEVFATKSPIMGKNRDKKG